MRTKLADLAKLLGGSEGYVGAQLAKSGIEIAPDGTVDTTEFMAFLAQGKGLGASPAVAPETPSAPKVTEPIPIEQFHYRSRRRKRQPGTRIGQPQPVRSLIQINIVNSLRSFGFQPLSNRIDTVREFEMAGNRVSFAMAAIHEPNVRENQNITLDDPARWEFVVMGAEVGGAIYLYSKDEFPGIMERVREIRGRKRATIRHMFLDKDRIEHKAYLFDRFRAPRSARIEKEEKKGESSSRAPADKPPPGVTGIHPLYPHPSAPPGSVGGAAAMQDELKVHPPKFNMEMIELIREYIEDHLRGFGVKVLDKGRTTSKHLWGCQTKSGRRFIARVVATTQKATTIPVKLNTKEKWDYVILGQELDTVYLLTRKEVFPVEKTFKNQTVFVTLQDNFEIHARAFEVLK